MSSLPSLTFIMNLKNRDGQSDYIDYIFIFLIYEQTTTTFNSIFNHNKNVNKCNPVSSTASTNDDLSGSFECSHIWKHWKISRGIEDKNLGSRILAVR